MAPALETLKIGDTVMTADGRGVPVKWIGRQTVVTLFGLSDARRPVVIEAGALAEGQPSRPLRLTSDHALLIDGLLVLAGALVNGDTIRRIPNTALDDRFTVFHVETENHEVILAEGVPAETLVANVTRRRFDNFAEYEAMFGDHRMIDELALPRVKSARQLPASIRAGLARRAAACRPAETAAP